MPQITFLLFSSVDKTFNSKFKKDLDIYFIYNQSEHPDL